jgi:hypothetical protein
MGEAMPQVDRLEGSAVATLVDRAGCPHVRSGATALAHGVRGAAGLSRHCPRRVAWNVQEMSMVARRHSKQAQRIVDL